VAVVQYTYTQNNTGNVTKKTIHRTTQKIHRATQKLGSVRAGPRLCGFHPGICLTTEEKAWKKTQFIPMLSSAFPQGCKSLNIGLHISQILTINVTMAAGRTFVSVDYQKIIFCTT
jgi:hypothetical protein